MILNNYENRKKLAIMMVDNLSVELIRIQASETLEEQFRPMSDEEFDALWDEWHEERQRDEEL